MHPENTFNKAANVFLRSQVPWLLAGTEHSHSSAFHRSEETARSIRFQVPGLGKISEHVLFDQAFYLLKFSEMEAN